MEILLMIVIERNCVGSLDFLKDRIVSVHCTTLAYEQPETFKNIRQLHTVVPLRLLSSSVDFT